jgi:hypothetical protein
MSQQNQETGVSNVLNLVYLKHKSAAANVLAQVQEGTIDPVQVQLAMKQLENFSKAVIEDKNYKESLLNAVRKLDKDSKYFGHKIAEAIVHTSYDYKACNDPLWNELNRIQNEIKEKIKLREQELNAGWPQNTLDIPRRTVVIDKMPNLEWLDCGEDAIITPPVKRQITGVKTTLAKE